MALAIEEISLNGTHDGAVEKQVREVAEAIGEERSKVRVLDPKWSSMLRNGAIVTPHVYRWRAESALSLEDFGIQPKTQEEAKAWRRILRIGTGYLLPEDERRIDQRLETQYRELVKRYAFETHLGYFMAEGDADPVRGRERGWLFREWRDQANKIAAEYKANAERRFEHWDDLMATVREDYRTVGVQNYHRLQAAGVAGLGELDEWVERFIERRMAHVPSKAAVRDSYAMTYDVDVVPLAAAMASDQAAAAAIIADQSVVSEMQQAKLETARKKFEEGLDPFIADVKAKLYRLVYGASQDVLASLRKNTGKGSLSGGSVKQLRNLVKQVEKLNLWDDMVLTGQMAEIRDLLAMNAAEAVTTGSMEQTLSRIEHESLVVLKQIQREPERAEREMVLSDPIEELEVAERHGHSLELETHTVEIDLTERGARN